MSRSLTAAGRAAMNAQETGMVFLTVLAISHDDMAETIYLVNNTEDVTYDGHTYTAWGFKSRIAPDRAEVPPSVQLILCNVDRDLVSSLRALEQPPTVNLSLISSTDLAAWFLEVGPLPFDLTQVGGDISTLTGVLAFEQILDEAFPAHSMTPSFFPGLFAPRRDTGWPPDEPKAIPAKVITPPRGWARHGRFVKRRP